MGNGHCSSLDAVAMAFPRFQSLVSSFCLAGRMEGMEVWILGNVIVGVFSIRPIYEMDKWLLANPKPTLNEVKQKE